MATWMGDSPSRCSIMTLRKRTAGCGEREEKAWAMEKGTATARMDPGTGIDVRWVRAVFMLPTGPAKPAGPVPVYRIGLAGNRSKPVEFKFEFKSRSATSSERLTGRFDQFTGRFGR